MHFYFVYATIAALEFSLSSAAREKKLTCGPPHLVPHASYTPAVGEASQTGTVVTYSCQFGYVGNKKTSQCVQSEDEKTAAWTIPQISCIPRSCGDPGFLENGDLIGTLYTFPNSVSFECEDGYRLIGNKQRFCLASGSWSGRLPRCESISCEPPTDPENGHFTYTSLNYLSSLRLECNKGYRLNDDTPVYCTADGVWSKTDLQCIEAACDIPRKPEHGNVNLIGSTSTSTAGTMAVFSCEGDRIPDGPTTSKCLDTGQWTFPTPQCLEPCNILEVENGKIGRYVSRRYSSSLTFTVIPVGTRIEDNEKLFLHCSSGYDPLGISTNWQQRVSCSAGKWSEIPFCEPKSCLKDIPDVPNATPIQVNRKHGGTIKYECAQDFKKTKHGDVNCQYGEWKGEIPVCKDTRCAASSLFSTGLDKGDKEFYKDGEHYEVKCLKGYNQVKGPEYNGRFDCEDGIWKGAMPPCVAASCTESPPSIEHGRAEVISTFHLSQVKYVCDDHYILMENGKVQCLYGQWTGQTPECADSDCYLKDLKNKAHLSPVTESFTHSGDALNVQCNDGYAPTSPLPLCLNGVWNRNEQTPCKERDCVVQWIANAEIKEQVLGPKYWNFWAFRYERKIQNVKVPYGTAPARHATLFLFCDSGYTFQGKGITASRIMCSEGRWSPDPVCLRPGMKYVPTTKKPITTTTTTTRKTATTTITSTTFQPTMMRISSTTTSPLTSPLVEEEETTLPVVESATEEACHCEYTLNDENIVAYTDGKILQVYDRVENGSFVQFRCKHVGFQHLVGQEILACTECQAWHANDFPVCVNPKQGDAVIVYDSEVTVSMEGVLEVLKGQNVRLSCIAVEEAQYPKWTVPHEKGITAVPERMERAEDYLYISHLDIANPTFENDGTYSCAVEKYPATTLELRVIDPDMRCPKFVIDGNLLVSYSENETRVGSKAFFSCQKDGLKLNDTENLTCTRTGKWSKVAPQCVPITCEAFKDTDLMQISYTDDQNVGSYANFHCFAPGKPKGVGRTRCLGNGQWQDEPPTCQTQPCEVDSLFSVIPKGVKPNVDLTLSNTMPYNSTIKLTCDNNLVLKGNTLAKCGKDGQWIVEELECVSGCQGFSTSPKLIITPEKEVYRFGEIVSFACAPGYDLKSEVEQAMCLSSGWSENIIPECIDSFNNDKAV